VEADFIRVTICEPCLGTSISADALSEGSIHVEALKRPSTDLIAGGYFKKNRYSIPTSTR